MFIKSLEDKIRLVRTFSIIMFVSSILICFIVSFYAYRATSNASNNIYVLDNSVPIIANRTNVLDNREVEKKAHVNYFHNLFFTLTPDNKYIEKQTNKALYLIDESGYNEHLNLKERGFYNSFLSSNSIMTIETDSIVLNKEQTRFTFYGKQKIARKSSVVIRELITEGGFTDIPRSEQNSHGILINNWIIKSNKNISEQANYNR